MIQVEWNKEHTWKITKKYVNGKLDSFKYQGLWYVPVEDYSGIETDACGNSYIGSDCCDNCPLEKDCFSSNPINEACQEFNKLCMRMEYKSKIQ